MTIGTRSKKQDLAIINLFKKDNHPQDDFDLGLPLKQQSPRLFAEKFWRKFFVASQGFSGTNLMATNPVTEVSG